MRGVNPRGAKLEASRPRPAPLRIDIGEVPVDVVSLAEAVDAIEALVDAGRGGAVFTPNVDHIVKAKRDLAFRAAYRAADLSFADGAPLVWASRLLGSPLPERVAGSDLVLPLAQRAARRGWRVYLLGGAAGDAARAADVLARRFGLAIVGVDAPLIDLGPAGAAESRAAVERVRAARPHLVYVALGAPKQEIWIHRHLADLRPAVALGIGASLAFVSGTLPRAPRWASRAGLEWLYRLAREPRRLWRRYLVDDVAFLPILVESWRRAVRERRR
jgi:N-acetylglucosaminyldiphosphoundecaprenol N-acetyl-beta-D-mannosaminyltransferase